MDGKSCKKDRMIAVTEETLCGSSQLAALLQHALLSLGQAQRAGSGHEGLAHTYSFTMGDGAYLDTHIFPYTFRGQRESFILEATSTEANGVKLTLEMIPTD